MVDGLWTVEFISSLNRIGKGVIVFNNNRLLGGDSGYYYSGNFTVENDIITGTANITRFDVNSISVFGDIGQLSLSFEGSVSGSSINGWASRRDNPMMRIRIVCNKKEEI